jgi:hypothetical protein
MGFAVPAQGKIYRAKDRVLVVENAVLTFLTLPMTRVLRFTSFVYIYVVVNKAGRFLWITLFFSLLTIA